MTTENPAVLEEALGPPAVPVGDCVSLRIVRDGTQTTHVASPPSVAAPMRKLFIRKGMHR